MSLDTFRGRLTRQVRGLGEPLLVVAAAVIFAEVTAASVLYGPALEALGFPRWRIGARLVGTGILLSLLMVAAVAILAAVFERRMRPGTAEAAAGAVAGGAVAAAAAVLAMEFIFPAGLPGDASSTRVIAGSAAGFVVCAALGAVVLLGVSSRRGAHRFGLRTGATIALAGVVLVLVPAGGPPPPPATPPPRDRPSVPLAGNSVLLVTVDTLRATHMSLYGYSRRTTPQLDRWARGGAVFEEAVTPKAYTAPALAAALTGMTPPVHGLQRHPGKLADAILTLPEMFAEAGYHTAAFVTNPAITDRTFRFDQGFVEWYPYGEDRARVDVVLPDVLAWLEQQQSVDGPFFLWVHLLDPHSPYRPPAPWNEHFVGDALYGASADVPMEPVSGRAGPFQVSLRDALGPDWRELGLGSEELSRPDYLISQYDGEIAFVDAWLAPFLERFRRLQSEAIVVLTADHGESVGEHGYMFAHGRHPYEPTARIPMVFSHPQIVPGRVSGLASLVDLVPTLAELLGLERGPGVQGRSLVPALLRGDENRRASDPDRVLHLEARNTPSYPTLALRTATEKLVLVPRRAGVALDVAVTLQLGLGPGGASSLPPEYAFRSYTAQLYDLLADPAEEIDLAATRPERVRALSEVLWRRVRADALQRAAIGTGDTSLDELDPATVEELRSLGYLQ